MKQLFAAILCAALGTICATAQTMEEIVANSIATTKMNTVQSVRLQGVATEYGQVSELKIECRSDAKALMTTTSKEIGVTAMCWYGGGGWTLNEMAGGVNKLPLKGAAEYEVKNTAATMGLAPRLDKAQSVEMAEPATVNNIPVFVLRAVFGDGDRRTMYVRTDNFLPVREIRNEPNQGNLDVVIDYADFQTTDGVTLPRKITKSVAGTIVSVVEITSVEINAPLSDAIFSPTGGLAR
jgi:hypothetical protein